MNSDIFGEGFPYTNFHDLNMDWIVKIAKDFLDQYTHLQETIETGETTLTDKYTELEALLQAWYNTHSEDIANQLATALENLSSAESEEVSNFRTSANSIGTQVINSIPADYTALSNNVMDFKTLANNTDLDTLQTHSVYRLVATYTYAHKPGITPNENAILFVYHSLESTYVTQQVMTYGDSILEVYSRVYSSGAWAPWHKNFDGNRLELIGTIAQNTDFNDVTEYGIYRGVSSYSSSYIHNPPMPANFLMIVMPQTASYIVQQCWNYGGNGSLVIYNRLKSGSGGGTWTDWRKQIDLNIKYLNEGVKPLPASISMGDFVATAQATQGNNVGTELTVVSYNIANYNNDTSTYISDTQIFNLKRLLHAINADILCLQEDTEYIDANSAKPSTTYIYRPVYPNVLGVGGPTIRSKRAMTGSNTLKYSNGRVLRYGLMSIDNKTVLVINTHPSPFSSENEDQLHAVQYEELFKWANGQISLQEYSGQNYVYAPTHTHCIIGMDANSGSSTDKTLLQTLSQSYDFVLGNGGEMGWLITHPAKGDIPDTPLDNIVVSDNIIINDIEVYTNMYEWLHSDHLPVMAKLTLL